MELRRKLEAHGAAADPHAPRPGLPLRRARRAARRETRMSLTTRVSAFFLAALALVLAGFSATLYLLARTYLAPPGRRAAGSGPGHAGGRGRHRAGRPGVGAGTSAA